MSHRCRLRLGKIKLKLLWFQHVRSVWEWLCLNTCLTENTSSHVSLLSQRGMVAEGSGCWFPGFLTYLLTGWCNQGALFQPVGLGPSRKHACRLAFITNSQLRLKQAREGTPIVLTWESSAPKACTKELSETSRALESIAAKVINLRGKEQEGQGGQG